MISSSCFYYISYCNPPFINFNDNKFANIFLKTLIKSSNFSLILLVFLYVSILNFDLIIISAPIFTFIFSILVGKYISKDFQKAIKLALESFF